MFMWQFTLKYLQDGCFWNVALCSPVHVPAASINRAMSKGAPPRRHSSAWDMFADYVKIEYMQKPEKTRNFISVQRDERPYCRLFLSSERTTLKYRRVIRSSGSSPGCEPPVCRLNTALWRLTSTVTRPECEHVSLLHQGDTLQAKSSRQVPRHSPLRHYPTCVSYARFSRRQSTTDPAWDFRLSRDCLLGCLAVQSDINWPKSQKCLLPPSSVRRAITYHPDDGGKKHFRNVGQLLPDHPTQYPRRQSSSGFSLMCTNTSTSECDGKLQMPSAWPVPPTTIQTVANSLISSVILSDYIDKHLHD
jgi:hypothetical protein